MKNPEIISATQASRSFSDLLNRVCYGGESFVIKKGGRAMAQMIPTEELRPKEKPGKAKKNPPMPAEMPITPASQTAWTPPAPVYMAPPPVAATVAAAAVMPSALHIPENFSAEDVDFYADLIATLGNGQK